ncbi:MAG: Kelch repeat-containing protein [Luminiphilus sp.]
MIEPVNEVSWEQLPDMPVGKWEPASLVLDDKLYVLGGYENDVVSSRRVDVFDPADGSWTQLQDSPSRVSHVDLVADGNGFWFAGGMKDKPTRKIKDHIIAEVWYLNLELDRYTAGPLLPGRRAGGGLARLGDKLHYVSGLMEDRDTDSPDHFVLDLKEWAEKGHALWTRAAPLPVPRNQHSIAELNGMIYIIGGQFNHDLQQLDQVMVDVYDPQSDSWSEGPPLPVAHSHSEGATFVHGDRIWMVGGHSTPEGGKKGFCGNVVTLREGEEWEVTCHLPKPISSPASRIINDKLYVAGGWDGRMDDEKEWLSSPEVWVAEVGNL